MVTNKSVVIFQDFMAPRGLEQMKIKNLASASGNERRMLSTPDNTTINVLASLLGAQTITEFTATQGLLIREPSEIEISDLTIQEGQETWVALLCCELCGGDLDLLVQEDGSDVPQQTLILQTNCCVAIRLTTRTKSILLNTRAIANGESFSAHLRRYDFRFIPISLNLAGLENKKNLRKPILRHSEEDFSVVENLEIWEWDQGKDQMQWINVPRTKDMSPNSSLMLTARMTGAQFVNPELRKVILTLEEKLRNDIQATSDGGTGLGSDSLTARFQHFNLLSLRDQSVQYFWRFIRECYLKLLDRCQHPRQSVYIQCWANVLRKGQKIGFHVHDTTPEGFISGNYSVTSQWTKTIYSSNANRELKFSVDNISGSLIIFPSSVPHESLEHTEEDVRITIAFDLFLEQHLATLERKKNVIRLFDTQ